MITGEPFKWTLQRALHVIFAVAKKLRKAGYHLALGGSVLNRGWSDHDVDFYLLPLMNETEPNLVEAFDILRDAGVIGIHRLADSEGYPLDKNDYYHLYRGSYEGGPVDLFVVLGRTQILNEGFERVGYFTSEAA